MIAQGDPDHGHIRVPPIPQGVVMTDRDDATLWRLSWGDGDYDSLTLHFDAKMRFAISDDVPRDMSIRAYGVNEGPYFTDTLTGTILRFFVRGGRLGYEVASDLGPGVSSMTNGKVFGRVGLRRTALEVILPNSWVRFDDPLAWEENSL